MSDASPYQVLLRGDLSIEALRCVVDENWRPQFDVEQRREREALIRRYEASGQRIIRDASGVFPPLFAFRDAELRDDELWLHCGLCDYPDYLLSNVAHPEWRSSHPERMVDPFGVSMVLESCDGFVLVARRSSEVADEPGQRHVVPAGHVHPPASVAEGVYLELEEELGRPRSTLISCRWIGLVRVKASGKPELIFHAKSEDAADLLRRSRGDEGWEMSSVEAVSVEPDRFERWMLSERDTLVPAGRAALELWNRSRKRG